MSKLKLLALPFLVSFVVSCIAFAAALFLAGIVMAGPLQSLESMTRTLVLMACTNGAAGLFGVVSGAGVAKGQKRWVALVLAVAYLVVHVIWGAWEMARNTQPADIRLELFGIAAFAVGVALAVILVRQRYTE